MRSLFDRENSGHDVRVCSAPADVSGHPLADLCFIQNHLGAVSLAQHSDSGTNLAGSAKSTLKRVIMKKRGLHRMQLAPFGQAFDRCYVEALTSRGKREAR